MFPTVDFSRVRFFVGPPFPLSLITDDAITVTSGVRDINIYLRKGAYDPYSLETFILLAHELVHALQIQKGRTSRWYFNDWIFRYLKCLMSSLTYKSGGGNGLENEAYRYGEMVRRLSVGPCRRSGRQIASNPGFGALPPSLVKTTIEVDVRCDRSMGPIIDQTWRAVASGLAFMGALVYTLIDWMGRLVRKRG